MTHARNKRRPCTVACRAFFASGNLGHIRIGDRLLRPSCREGGGEATRARTHPGAKVDSRPGDRDDACCAYPPRSNREDSDEVPENIAVRN